MTAITVQLALCLFQTKRISELARDPRSDPRI